MRARGTEYDVCDGTPAQGNRMPCAVRGEEMFEFVVRHEGSGGAIDVEAKTGEDWFRWGFELSSLEVSTRPLPAFLAQV